MIHKGNLFSALLVKDLALGRIWKDLRREIQKEFPGLRVKQVEDLHITIVYVGSCWKPDRMPEYRDLALISPPQDFESELKLSFLGARKQVIALELLTIPEVWDRAIASAKRKMVERELKPFELWDEHRFRAHVSLVQTKNRMPRRKDLSELRRCGRWLSERPELSCLNLQISKTTPIDLLLAGATRPSDATDYISMDDFMKTYFN